MASHSCSDYTSSTSHDNPDLELSAPWALIRSSVSELDVSSIRRKFFIPDDYQIIVPGPKDRIDKPPDRCLAFPIATLEAGLRFPLARPVEDILSGLDVCPAQLVPNSFKLVLVFIVLMRRFKVEPSFARFWSLNTIRPIGSEKGFFYIAPQLNCKLVDSLSKVNNWKDRFIFVKSPKNRPWRVPLCWNLMVTQTQFRVLGPPLWDEGFVSGRLAVTTYDACKILKEEVLVMASLSPAPIETTTSLEMAVRASVITANTTREQNNTQSVNPHPATQVKKRTNQCPPIIRCSKREESCSKRARAGEVVVPRVEWVRNAEKIVGDMRSGPQDEDIGFAGSVLKSSGCEGALEMYRRNIRRADQLTLADVPLVKLEDVAAYHSSATNAVIHHLLLRAAYLEHQLQSCKSKKPSEAVDKKPEDRAGTESLQKLEELEKYMNHSNVLNRKLRQCLEDSESRLKELERASDLQREDTFNAGRAAGRKEFLESDEFYAAMNKTREKALKAFVKSRTYATAVAKSAAALNPVKNENFGDVKIEDAQGEDEYRKPPKMF